jgi:hypothetical protein
MSAGRDVLAVAGVPKINDLTEVTHMSRVRFTAVVIACVALAVPVSASAAEPAPLVCDAADARYAELYSLNQQIKDAYARGDTAAVTLLTEQARLKRMEYQRLADRCQAEREAAKVAAVADQISKDETATAAAIGNPTPVQATPVSKDEAATAAAIGTPTAVQVNLPAESKWTFCATEGARCAFTGTRQVRYGADGKFTLPRTFTDGVDCGNAVFGDPAFGVVKQCQVTAG